MIEAREAEKIGLVNKVVPLQELEREVTEMAKKTASNFSLSVKLMRSCVNLALESGLSAALRAEIEASCLSVASGEREVAAAKEKRRTQSTGAQESGKLTDGF